jgi:hypothetical protein
MDDFREYFLRDWMPEGGNALKRAIAVLPILDELIAGIDPRDQAPDRSARRPLHYLDLRV